MSDSDEGAIAGSKTSAPGRPTQQPILRPPWGQDPSACGLFQPGYRNKHEGLSLLSQSTALVLLCVRLLNRFPGGSGFPVPLAVVRFGLYEAAPLHSVSRFGVCGKSYGAERREELRYDEGRRKGVGSNGLRLDGDSVTRFRGCPGSAGESPDHRFLVGR